MALKYNTTTIPVTGTIKYKNTSLKKVIYNKTTVWEQEVRQYFFNNGTVSSGGFHAVAVNGFDWGWGGTMTTTGTITNPTSTTMQFTGNTSHYDSFFSQWANNLTYYKKLVIVVTSAKDVQFGVTNSGKVVGYTGPHININSAGTYSIDTSSLTGDYYIAVCIKGKGHLQFSQIYFIQN